jgi:lysozyme family protein
MLENRQKVIPFILQDEGGIVIRPDGGRSNLGIEFHTLADYNKRHKLPLPSYKDLEDLTPEKATMIYFELFFDPCHFDDFNSGIDYAVVDACINLGVGGCADLLEDEFILPRTHKFDPHKIRYINGFQDVEFVINSIRDAWIEHKRLQPLYSLRGKGWENRDQRVRERALKLARGEE